MKRIFRFILKTIQALVLLSILSVVIFRFVPILITPLMLIRSVDQLMSGQKVKMDKEWKSLEHISPNLVLAVVASEDNLFTSHHGFDFGSIEKAMENNGKKKHNTHGASTISQQTAKNVFLWPGRSYVRKAFEAYFTVLIELFWSKRRIMEVYLNVIETGDGIYGAEAASRAYYHKHAENLTKEEAALIAAILPNPRKWSPNRQTDYLVQRKVWILWNMNNVEKVDL